MDNTPPNLINDILPSIGGKVWLNTEQPENLIELFAERLNISTILAKILLNRNVDLENARYFFNPKLKHCMPDPYCIKDMDSAVKICEKAILSNHTICIFGDYDVDGITSTASLLKYFQNLNCKVIPYIPNRFQHGYGGNMDSIEQILTSDINLVIMVDNGSSSYDEITTLKNNNKQVIILDHHTTPPLIPPADALVNPNRLDDGSGLGYLCSAGIVFLFLVAINRVLITKNYFINNNLEQPNLLDMLDLTALATICDMVPQVGLNRAYVVQGLKVLANHSHLGLKTLLEVIDFNGKITAETLGFTIGPIINAASRLGKEQLALDLLTTDDSNKAYSLALTMKELNLERQQLEDQIINNAVEEINKLDINSDFIFLGSPNWSKGLVGIVAGRIKESHNKPTCIYAINEADNTATASGRSIPGVDLGAIVIAAKQADLLIKGGGHAQAIGFSFEISKKATIEQFFKEKINQQLKKAVISSYKIDDALALSAVNTHLVSILSSIEPFGINFSEPIFRINGVFLKKIQQIGKYKNHICFEVSDGFRNVKGICFKAIPSKLGDFLLNTSETSLDILVTVKGNFYKGNTYPNLILQDILT